MKSKLVNTYQKHGCNFSGNLVVIDYWQQLKEHPRFGEFGACSYFDILPNAKAYLEEHFPDAEILIAIPEIVARI